MRATPKAPKAKARPPVRVRRDPPTLEEAVLAAQGFIEDIEQQAEFAAALMEASIDEARPLVLKAAAAAKRAQTREVAFATDRSGGQRAVVVERKVERRPAPAVTVERKPMFWTPGGGADRSGGATVERKPFLGGPRGVIRLGGGRR